MVEAIIAIQQALNSGPHGFVIKCYGEAKSTRGSPSTFREALPRDKQ